MLYHYNLIFDHLSWWSNLPWEIFTMSNLHCCCKLLLVAHSEWHEWDLLHKTWSQLPPTHYIETQTHILTHTYTNTTASHNRLPCWEVCVCVCLHEVLMECSQHSISQTSLNRTHTQRRHSVLEQHISTACIFMLFISHKPLLHRSSKVISQYIPWDDIKESLKCYHFLLNQATLDSAGKQRAGFLYDHIGNVMNFASMWSIHLFIYHHLSSAGSSRGVEPIPAAYTTVPDRCDEKPHLRDSKGVNMIFFLLDQWWQWFLQLLFTLDSSQTVSSSHDANAAFITTVPTIIPC